MKQLAGIVVALACISMAVPVLADPPEGRGWKKHHHDDKSREYKEEYWDGNCKVERKYKKNGDYKEERECEGAPHYSRNYDDGYYAPPPPVTVYAPPPPPLEAEIVVSPPAVVLEAPTVVIEPPRVIVR